MQWNGLFAAPRWDMTGKAHVESSLGYGSLKACSSIAAERELRYSEVVAFACPNVTGASDTSHGPEAAQAMDVVHLQINGWLRT
jgi:hypothetical protein